MLKDLAASTAAGIDGVTAPELDPTGDATVEVTVTMELPARVFDWP